MKNTWKLESAEICKKVTTCGAMHNLVQTTKISCLVLVCLIHTLSRTEPLRHDPGVALGPKGSADGPNFERPDSKSGGETTRRGDPTING